MGRLGDQPINLILDTGASRTIIGDHLTQDLPPLESDLEETFAAGINAQKMEVKQVILPELILGDCIFRDFQVFSTDLNEISNLYRQMVGQPIDGLVGSDFLVKYKASINFRMRKIILYP